MMKLKTATAIALCLTILVPGMAAAQVKKAGGAYLLRLKLKKGDVHKYSIGTSITGLPAEQTGGTSGPIVINGTLEQKVLSITGKLAKVQITTGAMTMQGGMTVSQPQTTTIDVDDLGNGSNAKGQAGFGIQLPKNPIKIGGTWSKAMVLPGAMGARGTGTATYRFNGIKKQGKKMLADISFSIASTGMMKGGSGRAYLSPTDGSLANLTMKLSVSNPQGGPDLNTSVNISSTK
jgi:hypothetical protein